MQDIQDLLSPESSAPPAVRRPAFQVSFGSGSADDWKQSLVSLTVEAGLAPAVDAVEIHLSGDKQAPGAAVGDTGSVSLGYEDSSTDLVFTGQLERMRYSVQGTTRFTAINGGSLLAKLRVNSSYEQQKAGDIVRNLAGKTGVDTDSVEDGVDFPFYVVDDRCSALWHVAALARKSGFLAYFTPKGALNFAPFNAGQPVQTFTYAVDILSLQIAEAAPVIGTVTTIGEGAAGSQGQDAWSRLVKDPSSVKGNAGNSDPAREIQDATLRSSDAARSAAEGIANAASLLKLSGKLLVPGTAAVTVGSTIKIDKAPQDTLNGLCMVRGVLHHYSKWDGFTTLILFSKVGNGGAGGLAGLVGGLL